MNDKLHLAVTLTSDLLNHYLWLLPFAHIIFTFLIYIIIIFMHECLYKLHLAIRMTFLIINILLVFQPLQVNSSLIRHFRVFESLFPQSFIVTVRQSSNELSKTGRNLFTNTFNEMFQIVSKSQRKCNFKLFLNVYSRMTFCNKKSSVNVYTKSLYLTVVAL